MSLHRTDHQWFWILIDSCETHSSLTAIQIDSQSNQSYLDCFTMTLTVMTIKSLLKKLDDKKMLHPWYKYDAGWCLSFKANLVNQLVYSYHLFSQLSLIHLNLVGQLNGQKVFKHEKLYTNYKWWSSGRSWTRCQRVCSNGR